MPRAPAIGYRGLCVGRDRRGIVALDMRAFSPLPTMIILLAATTVVSSSEPTMRRVAVYDGLASFEVPAGWREIPPEVLEYLTLQGAEASGGRTAEIYQYGFQPGEAESGFSLPQILVQIRESGRLRYGQFLHLPPLSVLRSETRRRPPEKVGRSADRLALNQASFDRASYSLRTSHTFFLANVGRVAVVSASFLTERGVFTVHCYTAASAASLDRPLFDKIISSVHLDPQLAYRPRLADRWPPSSATLAFAAAALASIVVLVVALRRKARR